MKPNFEDISAFSTEQFPEVVAPAEIPSWETPENIRVKSV